MRIAKHCEWCKNPFYTYISGKFCSSKCYGLYQRGKKHPWRKLEKYGYSAIHKWLKNNFGKPNKCEMSSCKKISDNFEWALKKGKEYEKKRENFIQLCVSCHRIYDFTENQRKKISLAVKGRKVSKKTREKMALNRFGIPLSKEVKRNISLGQKKRWSKIKS